jgi:hypothetical protein
MASLVLAGDTSGSITVSAPAISGSNTQTLVAITGTLAPVVSGTAVATTSGTSVDFSSLPSWVKRVTVMFSQVSTSGSSALTLRLAGSGGVEATGYLSASGGATSGGAGNAASSTTGFRLGGNYASNLSWDGSVTLTLLNASTNIWVISGVLISDAGTVQMYASAGTKTITGALTQVRITTDGGTDTFDAGSINILYE